MIQRYGLFGQYDDWQMEPDSDGEFVLFSDHVAEVAEAQAEVARLRDAMESAMPDEIELYRLIKKSGHRKHFRIARLIADHLAAIRAALAHPIADVERVAQGEGSDGSAAEAYEAACLAFHAAFARPS